MAVLIGKDTVIETDLSGLMVPITQVEQISLPDIKNNTVNYDPLTSQNDWPEKIPVSLEIGSISCTVAYDPDDETHKDLDEAAQYVHTSPFKVRVTKGSRKWEFYALGVDADAVEFTRRDKVSRKYTFVLKGPVGEDSSASSSSEE